MKFWIYCQNIVLACYATATGSRCLLAFPLLNPVYATGSLQSIVYISAYTLCLIKTLHLILVITSAKIDPYSKFFH